MQRRSDMPKLPFCVLCALLALLILPGCSHEPKPSALVSAKGVFDELRAAVLREIKDPERANQVTVLVDQLEQLMIDAAEARKEHAHRMRSLNANYDATEEDFRALFTGFNVKQKIRQDWLLVIDERAREITTDREWKALSQGVAHALEASAKAELGL